MSKKFENGTRGPAIASSPNKVRITIRLDQDVVDYFKGLVLNAGGGNYQTLINDSLRQVMEADSLEDILRKVIREELKLAG